MNNQQISPSCVRLLNEFLKRKGISIDINGILSRILSSLEYKIYIINLISLIIIRLMIEIIKDIPLYPITIISNHIYSHVAASSLSRFHIPFIFCKKIPHTIYYHVNGKQLAFDGPNIQNFSLTKFTPIIPLSMLELKELEKHTNLTGLDIIQSEILNTFHKQDGVYLITQQDLINTDERNVIHDPIIEIKRFTNTLIYVATTNTKWLTQYVITDDVEPLKQGETISSLYGQFKEKINTKYNIYYNSDSCIIKEPELKTILTRKNNYLVESDFTIKELDDISDNESIIYNLQQPRNFQNKDTYITHPYHIPTSWDPLLSIMIITRALTKK